MLAYAGFGAQAARFLRSSAAVWLDRICGGVLLALASLRHLATLGKTRRALPPPGVLVDVGGIQLSAGDALGQQPGGAHHLLARAV